MSRKSLSAILTEINTLFADNTAGDISEADLRQVCIDIRDSFAHLDVTDAKYDASNPDNFIDISAITDALITSKVLTGLSVTGSNVASSDTLLAAIGKLQNQINNILGGVSYQGGWDAAGNTPALANGVGTKGHYYVVTSAGSTSLDGITDWKLGDWAIFNGSVWEKVDNTDAVISVNGYSGIVTLSKTDLALGNVDNTSDANKPVSTAQQTALDAKADIEPLVSGGTAVKFDKGRTYGSEASPETGNITLDAVGAKVGVVICVIHNHSVAPTFGAQFKRLTTSDNYITGVNNYIYMEYRTASKVIYSITREV